jgi:hypothetical protein
MWLRSGKSSICITSVLGLIGLLAGCGSGLPGSSSLVATITPPNASATANSSVALTGTGTGFAQTPLPQWQMQESSSVPNEHCGFILGSTSQANFTNCPMGYVVYDPNKFPSLATYYAPPAEGVYHVQFIATQFSTFDHVSATTTAAMTATP